jgi:hypothetical protein
VLFELGPSRQQDLALRDRVRRWQPQLRLRFLTRVALLKYRVQLPSCELPESVRVAQQEFDGQLAKKLDGMANRIDGDRPWARDNFEDSFERLEQSIRTCCSEKPKESRTVTSDISCSLAQNRKLDECLGRGNLNATIVAGGEEWPPRRSPVLVHDAGNLWLTGFGIASQLPHTCQAPRAGRRSLSSARPRELVGGETNWESCGRAVSLRLAQDKLRSCVADGEGVPREGEVYS